MRVKQTIQFRDWMDRLRDRRAVERIRIRIARLEAGNFGDVKFFGPIGELRVDYGPGYRVYFTQRGGELVILLCGGDKSSQKRDFAAARALADEIGTE
jgi:putative addiction module killer protein